MLQTDEWFHDQVQRRRAGRVAAVPACGVRGWWTRRRRMTVASVALVVVMGLLANELRWLPLRADQPFGIVPPAAVLRAAAMPAINGHAMRGPHLDRNHVVATGVGR